MNIVFAKVYFSWFLAESWHAVPRQTSRKASEAWYVATQSYFGNSRILCRSVDFAMFDDP